MRLDRPRIAPMSEEGATPEQLAALEEGRTPDGLLRNVSRTTAHAPGIGAAFKAWMAYIADCSLPLRDRQIVILRTLFVCRAGCPFSLQSHFARLSGLPEADVARIKQGPDAGWDARERALIMACDEMAADQFVSDATWRTLESFYSRRQIMDVVFACSFYVLVAINLNSFGVQVDADMTLDPDLRV